MNLYFLDLIGVFAFAFYGAHKGVRAKYDIFGIFICAALTALGGGTIRELIINSQPVFLYNYTYIVVTAFGAAFAVCSYRSFSKIHRYMLMIDAVGLSTFAFLGAQRANQAGLGLGAMICFAVLTAAGGGVLCDIATHQKPQIFSKDFYAFPAALLAVGYFLFQPVMEQSLGVGLLLGATFMLRMSALYLRVQVWVPFAKGSKRHIQQGSQAIGRMIVRCLQSNRPIDKGFEEI